MKSTAVYGPPGTGKSTFLLHEMNEMVEAGADPREIAFLSFTKAAAEELTGRVNRKLCHISTIHSLSFRQAGLSRDQILDRNRLKEYSRLSGYPISGANPDEDTNLTEGDEYLALYQFHHSTLSTDYKKTYFNSDRPGDLRNFLRFAEGLDRYKEANGFLDFNDMLKEALSASRPAYNVMFIDEAQDLTPLQWKVIDHWAKTVKVMYIAGDDDQAIFTWGGADAGGMPAFEKRHRAKRVVLSQSYRVPRTIHHIAHKLIINVKDRVNKQYKPRDAVGQIEQWQNVSYMNDFGHGDDVMILYRNHYLRKEIEQHLMRRCIPYTVDSGLPGLLDSYYRRAIDIFNSVKRNYKHMGHIGLGDRESAALLKNLKPIYAQKFRDGKIKQILKLDWQRVLNMPTPIEHYLTKVLETWGTQVTPTIRLSTFHGSKGREADRVILINGMSNRSQGRMAVDPDPEIRTFYVGVTRAKRRLDIVSSENPMYML